MRKWHGSLLGKLPEGLQDIVKLLLNPEPTVRPDPDQLAKVSGAKDHVEFFILSHTEQGPGSC
ncbi:hypothetical protein DPMN_012232 [Dreissena polymorpha]|uniref:Uncharacterized protein n=1 Tax=Dreissena polymorpha TaxID=45954 RepID=A0A9D4N552_DREPO|nr:hypothetical protein DPMN_012232 [Dreissena polymorpha]